MNRTAIAVMIGIFAVGTAAAQSEKDMTPPAQGSTAATSQGPAANGSLANGSAIDAALTKSLDSKKAKKGDPVSARITEDAKGGNGTVIPKGAKLEGHLTQVSSRDKGDSYSTLGIVFDKAVLKNGEEIPLNVQVQAIAISQEAATAPAAGGMGGMSPSGGGSQVAGPGRSPSSGGMESRAGEPSAPAMPNTNAASNTDTNNAMAGKGATGGLTSSGLIQPGSRGVFGLQGIGLAAAADGAQQAAVVTSTDKNVHLDGGTQFLLVTMGAKS
jgi:hypothetical protein